MHAHLNDGLPGHPPDGDEQPVFHLCVVPPELGAVATKITDLDMVGLTQQAVPETSYTRVEDVTYTYIYCTVQCRSPPVLAGNTD